MKREFSGPASASSDITCRVIPSQQLHATPWKNGEGTTREIAVSPPEAEVSHFVWRVSLASVNRASTFSCFDDVDRIITLAQGQSMVLRNTADGSAHALQPGASFRFAGEAPIQADLPDGPIQAFNIMWRRGKVEADVCIVHDDKVIPLRSAETVLHCAEGSCELMLLDARNECRAAYTLTQGDTLVLTQEKSQSATAGSKLKAHGQSAGTMVICANLDRACNTGTAL